MNRLATTQWPISVSVDADGGITVGGCSIGELARKFGTPLYVFDAATLRGQCRAYRDAMGRVYPGDYEIHYAGKALLNTAIAQLVAMEGLGLDVVSSGEMALALNAGIAPAAIALHGNAKTRDELDQAVQAQIGHIVIDNLDEIAATNAAAKAAGRRQAVMLRLSPAIAVDTHRHVRTGQRSSKFGLPVDQLEQAAIRLADSPNLQLDGLHFHLGSQLRQLPPYAEAITVALDVADWFAREWNTTIKIISPGGGLGIDHAADDNTPTIDALVETIAVSVVAGCRRLNMPLPKLVLEPGRSIVGRAGVVVYRVVGQKHVLATQDEPEITFLHADGGMGDNLRPSLYGAQYTACVVSRPLATATMTAQIAGRYCESGDIIVPDAQLPDCEPGDLIALAGAGAYTLSMASNYNLVPRPAVVLVESGRARLIQHRESLESLWARDLPLVDHRPNDALGREVSL
jgi:diaminopimelate decarboxylase